MRLNTDFWQQLELAFVLESHLRFIIGYGYAYSGLFGWLTNFNLGNTELVSFNLLENSSF